MDFQIIKIGSFDKIVLRKARLAVMLKFLYGRIQPDGLSQIEPAADFIQRMKNLVRARVAAAVFDDGILYHTVVLKNFSPQTKHIFAFPF